MVSVLVPVYNGQKYIYSFLESVCSQTYRYIEIIIIDDCSKDRSYNICKTWTEKNKSRFKRARVFRNNANIGLTGNTNKLFRLAAGKYIFLADQDDVWLPNKIEHQVRYMEDHPKCIVSLTDRSITDEELNVKLVSEFRNENYSITSLDLKQYLMHRTHGTSANKMCIRNGLPGVLEIPPNVLEPDRFIASMAVCCGTIDYIYEPLVLYRIHQFNLSGNYCIQTSRSIIECFCRLYKAKKRVHGRRNRDNTIIKEEMKSRFHIRVSEKNSRFFIEEEEEESLLKDTWVATWKAYKAGMIGVWR